MRHFSELSTTAERIVEVAETLIQHAGYNGFSYDDVARQVGIKKPSIHHHFSTKADLVAMVAQRYTHRFREQLLHIETKHVKATERLVAYAALFQKTYDQNRRLCVCGMLGAEAEGLPASVMEEVHRFFAANLDWLSTVCALGQAEGQLHDVAKPRVQAEMYLCALEGAMVVGRGAAKATGPGGVGKAFVALISK
jgi:TetR/AcrR family transcriptional regulator, transcriptional repressor for nem operon